MRKRILSLGLLFPAFAFAQTASLINSEKAIKNLNSALSNLSHQTNLTVIFPKKIWISKKLRPYYLYTENMSKNQYRLSVDTSSHCNGAHYCSIGTLMGIKNGSAQNYESKDHQKITTLIYLNHKKKIWFTPSHAMGSYWPAQIEWRENSILYRLTWNVDLPYSEPSVLLEMAGSIQRFPLK